jgi:hypothetical protein
LLSGLRTLNAQRPTLISAACGRSSDRCALDCDRLEHFEVCAAVEKCDASVYQSQCDQFPASARFAEGTGGCLKPKEPFHSAPLNGELRMKASLPNWGARNIFRPMSTLAEIESAVTALPAREKAELLLFVAGQLRAEGAPPAGATAFHTRAAPGVDG